MKQLITFGLFCVAALPAAAQSTPPSTMPTPPLATSRPKALVSPYGTRTDNYYWLNERDNPEVLDYLKAENTYFDQQMAPVKDLEARLFTEMKGRIQEQDESVPYRDHGYYYYTRYEAGGEYPLYLPPRRQPTRGGGGDAQRQPDGPGPQLLRHRRLRGER